MGSLHVHRAVESLVICFLTHGSVSRMIRLGHLVPRYKFTQLGGRSNYFTHYPSDGYESLFW
jgi:hypothetical protein